ncbi:DUF1761 domain-containing protein [Catenuloplanes japonicus]|uniref:DUF1761 domain-containing protein n=1 Tax=Catenuloplanes japonicus TaxID=33876 RepID=UPI0005262A0C|nr:DUF1761 domain-containing protein [Catenuloplanes japonicus]
MNVLDAMNDVNWIAVPAAFVAYAVLGGVWFAVLFAKPYAASLGRDSVPGGQPVLFYVGPMVCSLIMVVASAVLMAALAITTVGAALAFALVVGVGYLVANTVTIAINPNMPRPLFYASISGAYHLAGITLTALILVALS